MSRHRSPPEEQSRPTTPTLRRWRRPPLPQDPLAPLLIRTPNWIGDVVLCLPVVEALARLRPGAPLTVATRRPALDVVDGHPDIAGTIEVPPSSGHDAELMRELRAGRFGAALVLAPSFRAVYQLWRAGIPRRIGLADDMRGGLLTHVVGTRRGRPAAHQVRDYLDVGLAVGAVPADPVPRMRPTTAHRQRAQEVLETLPSTSRVVAVAPFSAGGRTKHWPLHRFRKLAVQLAREEVHVLVVGGPGDGPAAQRLVSEIVREAGAGAATDLAGKAALPVAPLAALAPQVAALVSNDTGPMHVWAAGGGKVVAIFGSSLPGLHGPLGTGHRVLHRSNLPCAGCYLRSCPRDLECLEGITVRDVHDALRSLLGDDS